MHDPTSEAPLSIHLFGSFHACLSGQPLPSLRSRKGEWLLALLVLRAGRPVAREWLAENLWPDSLPDAASASLRQSLKDLRAALGEQAWRIGTHPGRRLGLTLTGAEIDVREFDALIRAGDTENLRRAVALYSGPLLAGCAEPWITAEREEREQAYLTALDRLARDADAHGDSAASISIRRLAAAAAPVTEPTQRALMAALAHGGDAQAAVEVYQQLRRRLYRELGAEPDAETTALFRQIRAEARHGHERGKPTATAGPRAPSPLTTLVGREVELAELEGRLLTARLVTLTGTGGVGKTRLALAAAELVAPQFSDGVCFVDLSALHNPNLLTEAVCLALGLEQVQGSLSDLARALSGRQLLLILDNCEHLLLACAQLARALVTTNPHLRLLATSREPLGLNGEVRVPVPPLSLPAEAATGPSITVAEAAAYPAVRLFCERAADIAPGFALTNAEVDPVLRVCRQLDGLPLALELAASLMDVLPLTEIAARLDDRFRLLSSGDPSRPERQQTLQAVVDWSYDRLEPAEQRLFRRAAVFAGNWSLAALEAVCAELELAAEGGVLPLLTRLVRKSLLVPEDVPGIGRRYRMLETLREYARLRLAETGEAEEFHRRHLDWSLAFATTAERELTGPAQAAALTRLDADHDNLRGTLEWALAAARGPELGRRGATLAALLGRYWQIRGLYSEGGQHLRCSLERIDPGATPEELHLQGRLLGWAGFLAIYGGQYAAAVELATRSLRVWETLGDERGQADALGTLAIAAKDQGNRSAARSLFEQCQQLWEQVDDPRGLAGALGYLGILSVDEHDLDSAEALFERALALRRTLQDTWGIAASLNNLGRLAASQGNLERARALLDESLGLRRELGDRRSIAVTLNSLGNLVLAQGDTPLALRLFAESLELVHQIGDRRSIAYSLEAVARLAITEGAPAEGIRLLAAAASLRAALPAPLSAAEGEAQRLLVEGVRKRLGENEVSRHQVAGEALSQAQAVTLARNVLQRFADQSTAAIQRNRDHASHSHEARIGSRWGDRLPRRVG